MFENGVRRSVGELGREMNVWVVMFDELEGEPAVLERELDVVSDDQDGLCPTQESA